MTVSRFRRDNGRFRGYEIWLRLPNTWMFTNDWDISILDTGVKTSLGHPFHRLQRTARTANVGGSFSVQRSYVSSGIHHMDCVVWTSPTNVFRWNSNYVAHIDCAVPSSPSYVNPSTDAVLNARGTTGIARSTPTNPLSNMGQFLVELREPPRIPGSNFAPRRRPRPARPYNRNDPGTWRTRAQGFRDLARGGSDEFLNATFGWLPFVQDLRDFFKVTTHLNELARQFHNDSGRNVRRRYSFPTSSVVSGGLLPTVAPYPSPSLAPNIGHNGKCYLQTTTTTNQWFSGAYTYYLPPLENNLLSWLGHYEAYAHHLYGIRLDPDLLWNIAPWTWAADWFANTGDIVQNWSAFTHDGLVLRYGYIMEHIKVESVYSLVGYMFGNGRAGDCSTTIIRESKVRRTATPYGFGLNPGSFTTRQNATIAALGINRGARWL